MKNTHDVFSKNINHVSASGKNKLIHVHHSYALDYQKKCESYKRIINKYPQLIHNLLNELLQIEGYSETVIGFGTGIQLDMIRKINTQHIYPIPQRVFFDILGLYARIFCNWYHYKDECESLL
jgi:hypothetical protein